MSTSNAMTATAMRALWIALSAAVLLVLNTGVAVATPDWDRCARTDAYDDDGWFDDAPTSSCQLYRIEGGQFEYGALKFDIPAGAIDVYTANSTTRPFTWDAPPTDVPLTARTYYTPAATVPVGGGMSARLEILGIDTSHPPQWDIDYRVRVYGPGLGDECRIDDIPSPYDPVKPIHARLAVADVTGTRYQLRLAGENPAGSAVFCNGLEWLVNAATHITNERRIDLSIEHLSTPA
ncbi:hypothetical protein OG921_16435 [Aldersonia sp. NBC_00410]|uniref:hypothetical protein n=1 Tax=Aldersonia sp. NBC_00410 TaxID=2975954 RepID=UPI002256C3BB|nr:hypothetical protein [Aldersonia sp. NBC_00410]MCX5044754.1 hypothetical protein [Aldersonia sp. NBC_00410]